VSAVGNIQRESPLITVGITCYNAERTVGRAIESAQRQDWPKLEIVIVDDGSSDDSVTIINRYAAHDGRIRLLRHDGNKGYAAALNTVLQNAKGEFVAVFDDDDVSVPQRISKQWRRLTVYEDKSDAKCVFCYANRDVVGAGPENGAGFVNAIGRSAVEPSGAAVADFILWHREEPACTWGQFGSCTLFARKEALVGTGGFDERFRRSSEWDLAVRAALSGAHFIAVDEALITQYITPTEDKGGDVPLEYALKLRRKHREYLKRHRVYLASHVIARARFHYAKNRRWASRTYLAVACMLSPFKVLPSELGKWRRRKTGRPAR
jgi:glycosyltransferase involved in cell wall biosynthesis